MIRTQATGENFFGFLLIFYKHCISPVKLHIRSVATILLLVLVLLPFESYGREEGTLPTIETQVLRLFATKNSGYYHKPWKSPDFTNLKASGFFFKDDKNFPDKEGLILTNAHAVSMAQSIKVSNGREKRRYDVKVLAIFDSADFAV